MPASLFDLSGQVALVTGGNGGIGRSVALRLAEAGANVAIWGRNAGKNAAVLKELEALGAAAIAQSVDLADHQSLGPAFEETERRLGPVSILVNNAGVTLRAPPLDLAVGDFERVLATNVAAPMVLSQLAARSMIPRQAGKIVNVSSATVAFGSSGVTAYAVSKAALIQLTKCLAVELAPHNIQVNAIAPGWVETAMTARVKARAEAYEYAVSRTPAGRWAEPDEIAGAVLYYASPASSYTTASTLFVDGGYTAKQ